MTSLAQRPLACAACLAATWRGGSGQSSGGPDEIPMPMGRPPPRPNCSQLGVTYNVWGFGAAGLDVGAYTNGSLRWLGRSSDHPEDFYCEDLEEHGIEFGSRDERPMEAALGEAIEDVFDRRCCSEERPSDLCLASLRQSDAQYFCRQLGYQTGLLLNTTQVDAACPTVHINSTGMWSSDFLMSNRTQPHAAGQRIRCSGSPCDVFVCPEGDERRPASTTFCGDTCRHEDCCLAPPVPTNCSAAICSEGHVLKVPLNSCPDSCTEERCCDPLGQCGTMACNPGFRSRADVEPYCNGTACVQSECCELLGECTPELCNQMLGFVVSPSVPLSCAATECTVPECCIKLGSCSAATCTEGYVLTSSTTASYPDHCAGAECTVEECCTRQAVCTSSVCPAGQVPKDAMDLPQHCALDQCQPSECCHRHGMCCGLACPHGYRQVSSVCHTSCLRSVCTLELDRDRCCEPVETCAVNVANATRNSSSAEREQAEREQLEREVEHWKSIARDLESAHGMLEVEIERLKEALFQERESAAHLVVEGIDCPSNYNEDVNGDYHQQGVTASGSPYYESLEGENYLYFDPDCNGAGEPARWIVASEAPNVSAAYALAGACTYKARIDSVDPVGPPEHGVWVVFCGTAEETLGTADERRLTQGDTSWRNMTLGIERVSAADERLETIRECKTSFMALLAAVALASLACCTGFISIMRKPGRFVRGDNDGEPTYSFIERDWHSLGVAVGEHVRS